MKMFTFGGMVLCFVVLVLMTPNVMGLNTYAVAGNPTGVEYYRQKDAAVEVHDHFDDYFMATTDYDDMGIQNMPSGILRMWQLRQPQEFVVNCHGVSTAPGDTNALLFGTSTEYSLTGSDWIGVNGIKNAGKNGLPYSRAPLSGVVLLSCHSAETSTTNNYKKVFLDNFYCHFFVGIYGEEGVYECKKFAFTYADEITHQSHCFKTAIKRADKIAPYKQKGQLIGKFDTAAYYQSTNYHHSTGEDKFVYFTSAHSSYEGSTLYDVATDTFEIYRSFSHTSNGGYIIFHGTIKDDLYDLTSDAKITLQVHYKSGSTYYWLSTNEYIIKNRELIAANPDSYSVHYYGGTDIVSWRLTPTFLNNFGNGYLKFTITNGDNDQSADNIKIDRFEYIEIGN